MGLPWKTQAAQVVLKVAAGDSFAVKTSAYFTNDDTTTSTSTAQQLATALLNALAGGGLYQSINEGGGSMDLLNTSLSQSKVMDAMQALKNRITVNGQKPQAFLNYLLLDENMNVLSDQSGFIQTTTPGSWSDLVVPQVEIKLNGYLIVFLSNESKKNVSFDNLFLQHWKGKLLEESHYYPYGLTITKKAFSLAAENKKLLSGKLLNNKEFSDGVGLDWYDFSARQYDPQIGRWMVTDPLSEAQGPQFSPYQYCLDNPVVFVDPSGMMSYWDENFEERYQERDEDYYREDPSLRDELNDLRDQNREIIFGMAYDAISYDRDDKDERNPRGNRNGDRRDWRNENYNKRGNGSAFDERGRELLGRWLDGTGEELFRYEGVWGDYMRANESLNDLVEGILKQDLAHREREDGYFSYNGHMEMADNGYTTGYEMLHGTDATVGDFEMHGYVEYNSEYNYFAYHLELVWNDIMDPNPKYLMDRIGSFGLNILYDPEDYEVEIVWRQIFVFEK